MNKIAVILTTGCEEAEFVIITDLLRRADFDVDTLSLDQRKRATGEHLLTLQAEMILGDADFMSYDAIILPGGTLGTSNLMFYHEFDEKFVTFFQSGKLLAAIGEAPLFLTSSGIVSDRRITGSSKFADEFEHVTYVDAPVVVDQNLITGRGLNAIFPFCLEIIHYFHPELSIETIEKSILFS